MNTVLFCSLPQRFEFCFVSWQGAAAFLCRAEGIRPRGWAGVGGSCHGRQAETRPYDTVRAQVGLRRRRYFQ